MKIIAMSEYIQVATTTDSKQQAEQIAQTLVEQRLAACVQIAGPIQSVYRWQGNIEQAEEWHCTIKTRRSNFENIAKCYDAAFSFQIQQQIKYHEQFNHFFFDKA